VEVGIIQKKVFASVRGIDNLARPIQIIMKSVKSVKAKTPLFMDALRENQGSMSNLVNLKSVKKLISSTRTSFLSPIY